MVATQILPLGGGGPPQVVEGDRPVVLTSKACDHRAGPSTILRMVPLPVPGRIYA